MRSQASSLSTPAAVLLLCTGIVACFPVLPTRFVVLEASRSGGEVDFMSTKLREQCSAGVLVFELSVLKVDCDRDCEQWDLTRRDRPEPADALTDLPIRYGQEIPYVTVVQAAKPLTPGVYSVGASMGCFIDGELIGQRVFGRFELPAGEGEIRNILAEQAP